MKTYPNTSDLLKAYFAEKRIRKSALSRKMGITIEKLVYNLKKESIQTQFLYDLSMALEHNFFMDIANLLPENYSVTNPNNLDLKNQISDLEKQVLILTTEKEIIMKLFGKQI